MAKTKAELIERALMFLGVGEAGQPVEVEDRDAVDKVLGPLLAQLAASRIVYVPNVEQIDDRVFLPLARYLANEAAPAFGRPYSEDERLAAELALRRAVASYTTFQPVKVDYF